MTTQVVAAIVQSVLAIARDGDDDGKDLSGGELVRAVKGTASLFRPLLDKYCGKTPSAQNDCLEAVEDFCVGDEATEQLRHPFSKACLQHPQTVVQPWMSLLHDGTG